MVTFYPHEKALENWRREFEGLEQGMCTVEEYFQNFLLLKSAIGSHFHNDSIIQKFWLRFREKLREALKGGSYASLGRLEVNAAILKMSSRDKKH